MTELHCTPPLSPRLPLRRLLVAALALACACPSPEPRGAADPAPKPAPPAAGPDASSPAAGDTGGPSTGAARRVQPRLMTAARAVIAHCQPDARFGWGEPCAHDELGAWRRAVHEVGLRPSLPTLAALLADDDASLSRFAADQLSRLYAGALPPVPAYSDFVGAPNPVDRDVARRVLDTLARLDASQASRVVPVATHLAVLTGQIDGLLKAIEPLDEPIRRLAVTNLMVFGRLDVLPVLQRIAKTGAPGLVGAALDATGWLPEPTGVELATICPWVADYLDDPRTTVGARAAHAMLRCGDEWRERLFVMVDERLATERSIDGAVTDALYKAAADGSGRALDVLRAVGSAGHLEEALRARARRHIDTLRRPTGVAEAGADSVPEARAHAELAGDYRGALRGARTGTVTFELDAAGIASGKVWFGSQSFRVTAHGGSGELVLGGASGADNVRLRGTLTPKATASGSWQATLGGRKHTGTWAAERR